MKSRIIPEAQKQAWEIDSAKPKSIGMLHVPRKNIRLVGARGRGKEKNSRKTKQKPVY